MACLFKKQELAVVILLVPGKIWALVVEEGPAPFICKYLSPSDKLTPLNNPAASVTEVPETEAIPDLPNKFLELSGNNAVPFKYTLFNPLTRPPISPAAIRSTIVAC